MIDFVYSNIFYFFLGGSLGFLSALRIIKRNNPNDSDTYYYYITLRTKEIGNVHFKYTDYESVKKDFDRLKKRGRIALSEVYEKDNLIDSNYFEDYIVINIDTSEEEELLKKLKDNPKNIIFNIKSIRWGDSVNVFQHYDMIH
jgi:hypothetical protein